MAINENRADSFLRMIRLSERGKLKIYLGYCAGVGKTYQMLMEAHRLKREGVDIVVGIVETHERKDTAALLDGLELISRRKVLYHGIEVEEMDIEAVLTRRPAVALVDELAHTNLPGSKNTKRYQDIEDLLRAGIHVISTLNVQHLESLYDTVERDLHVKVRERVPDKVLMEADQIINVDLTTEDFQKRLREGKVYPAHRINAAMEQFFTLSNLAELRELTLRELASQIDARRRDSLENDNFVPSSPDQVMVCLSSHSPNSEMLLRYASRLAGRLNRTWYAVYVQTAAENPTEIDARTQRILSSTLTLAKQLGAMVFTYKGEDVVSTILQFAGEYRVGHIVVGSPGKKYSLWRRLFRRRSIIERLIYESRGITITILDTRKKQEGWPASEPERTETIMPAKVDVSHNSVLRFAVLLPPERICFWETPLTKLEAINGLVDLCMGALPDFTRQDIVDAILKREAQGSTFLSESMAFPHARISGLKGPVLALGIAQNGIADYEGSAKPYFVFMIFSPSDMNVLHVQILGGLNRMALDSFMMPKLVAAKMPVEVNDVLREWDAFAAAKMKKTDNNLIFHSQNLI